MTKFDHSRTFQQILPSAAVFSACLLSQAEAQSFIPPLELCQDLYTIQKRQCAVERIYRCETSEGAFWRKDQWSVDDPYSIELVTLDGDFISAWTEDASLKVERVSDRTDPFSIEALLRNGSDDYDLSAPAEIPFFVEPIPIRFYGSVQLVGTETLNGVEFAIARENSTMQMNAVSFEVTLNRWIDIESGAYVNGAHSVEVGGNGMNFDETPAQIIRPGEPGFELTEGIYDCGELSQLAPPVMERKHL